MTVSRNVLLLLLGAFACGVACYTNGLHIIGIEPRYPETGHMAAYHSFYFLGSLVCSLAFLAAALGRTGRLAQGKPLRLDHLLDQGHCVAHCVIPVGRSWWIIASSLDRQCAVPRAYACPYNPKLEREQEFMLVLDDNGRCMFTVPESVVTSINPRLVVATPSSN